MQETPVWSWVRKIPGEGIGYPLQYSWASLVAQTIKNPPAMWENWVQSLDWEDALEEGMATHSSILVWRIPTDRGDWWATVHGVTKRWSHKALYRTIYICKVYIYLYIHSSVDGHLDCFHTLAMWCYFLYLYIAAIVIDKIHICSRAVLYA